MHCPRCAAPNPDAHRFCDACGEPLAVACADCGAVNRPGARFCGHCGALIDAAGSPDAPAAAERAVPPAPPDPAAARAAYEAALAEARSRGDRTAEVDALLGLTALDLDRHERGAADEWSADALALATELGDSAREGAALALQAACIAERRGPVAEARSTARTAVERSRDGDPLRRGRAVAVLGGILTWRADFDAGLPHLQEGLALAEQVDAAGWRAAVLAYLGEAALAKGRYDQALRWYADLCRLAEHAGDGFWQASAPHGLGRAYFELHDFGTAVDVCQEAADAAPRLAPLPEPHAHCLITLALAHLARGELGAAEANIRAAAALPDDDERGRWRWQPPLLRARAEVALAAERFDEAWAAAAESRARAEQADARLQVAEAKLVLGRIAAAQDRLGVAAQLLRAAVSLAEHLGARPLLWRASSALGAAAARLGAERDAETHLTQAAQLIEAIAVELADPELRATFTHAAPVVDVYRRLGRRPPP